MIDFQLQQNDIKQYIENNYQKHSDNNFNIVTDYLDFDRYKQNFIINIDFDNITFPHSNINDDCSEVERLAVNIYLVHRNNTPNNLNAIMLNAASAFYKLVKDMKKDNLFYDIKINNINFFKYIEGTTNIMASKFALEINIEI